MGDVFHLDRSLGFEVGADDGLPGGGEIAVWRSKFADQFAGAAGIGDEVRQRPEMLRTGAGEAEDGAALLDSGNHGDERVLLRPVVGAVPGLAAILPLGRFAGL